MDIIQEITTNPYLSNTEKHQFIVSAVQNYVDGTQPLLTHGFLVFWVLGGMGLFVLALLVRYLVDMQALKTGQYLGRYGYGAGQVMILPVVVAPQAIPGPGSPAYWSSPVQQFIDADPVYHNRKSAFSLDR